MADRRFAAIGIALALALSGCVTPTARPLEEAVTTTPFEKPAAPFTRLNVVIAEQETKAQSGILSAPDAQMTNFTDAMTRSLVLQSKSHWENALAARSVTTNVQVLGKAAGAQVNVGGNVPVLIVQVRRSSVRQAAPALVNLGSQAQLSFDLRGEATAELLAGGRTIWTGKTATNMFGRGVDAGTEESKRNAFVAAELLASKFAARLSADGFLPPTKASTMPAAAGPAVSTGSDGVLLVRTGAAPASPFEKVNFILAERQTGWQGSSGVGTTADDRRVRELGDAIYQDVAAATRAKLPELLAAQGIAVNVVYAVAPATPGGQIHYDRSKLDPAAPLFVVSVIANTSDLSSSGQFIGRRGASLNSSLLILARSIDEGWGRSVSIRSATDTRAFDDAPNPQSQGEIEANVVKRATALIKRLQAEGVLRGPATN